MINIVYTNSKCQDVFNIFKAQHDRYSKLPLFVISDNGGDFTYKIENIYPIGDDSFPLYSMQATIWNKNKFIELYENTKQEKWFECQVYEDCCKRLNINGVYYYNGEPKRGGHHDSSIYPYIATAVVKGK